MAPMLAPEHERALIQRAQAGQRAAIDEVVASHMRLVVRVAAKHARSSLSPHDLIAEGAIGLLEAIRRYDGSRQARFATYASFWVRACVGRFALANRRIVAASSTRGGRKVSARARTTERELAQKLGRWPQRHELAAALEVDEEEVWAVQAAVSDLSLSLLPEEAIAHRDHEETPEALVAAAELSTLRRQSVSRAMQCLTDREGSIVRESIAENSRSLAEMARELGVSRQRTGQIMADARQKLRSQLVLVA